MCIVTVSFMWPSVSVPWVGLGSVIVVFHDHIHLVFLLITEQKQPFSRCHF